MKTLLITNYWLPYNHSGTMRWLNLANHGLQFDVLTQEKPHEGFVDRTLPHTYSDRRIFCYGRLYLAFCFGALALLRVLWLKYDRIIITCPPQTLLFTAYVLQRLGRTVIVDMRDSIDGWDNKLRFLYTPMLKWIYKRIKNKVMSFQFLDEDATVIRSGYEDINVLLRMYKYRWKYDVMGCKRRNYYSNQFELKSGIIPDYRHKPKGYGSSSFCTLRHLGFKDLPRHFHKEVHDAPINSWSEAVEMYKKYLEKQLNK